MKKSGRLTLRINHLLHDELYETSKKLGLDLNGLINLLIRDGLPERRRQAEEATRKQRPWEDLSQEEQTDELSRMATYYGSLDRTQSERDFASSLAEKIRGLKVRERETDD